ncbi:hypothetical protein GGI07_003761 [Coemansia sp. Benny D115]|nr:hypothetical protein GGI07_003761 [Coemansia sp. Benny D115]
MARVSPEQVLDRLRQNGAYDEMRQQMQQAFFDNARGKEFEAKVKEILQWISEERGYLRTTDRTEYLERRLLEQLERQGQLEQLVADARGFWLTAEQQPQMQQRLAQGIQEAAKERRDPGPVARHALEIDPPRLSAPGRGEAGRTHSFYRRGDAVAAFVPVENPLSQNSSFICVMAVVAACDAPHNLYTVRDPDAAQGVQGAWAAGWEQLISLRRAYEYTYRVGDQVYALYRDDQAEHTQVTTEFFPARVTHVGPVSLAVRFDTGALAHVYYDEAFAAARVGFLRKCSDARKSKQPEDAMVEISGRLMPSFTGFWPDQAKPELAKHGRKVRYRQPPPLLTEPERQNTEEAPRGVGLIDRAIVDSAGQSAQPSSDMDTASTPDSSRPDTEARAPLDRADSEPRASVSRVGPPAILQQIPLQPPPPLPPLPMQHHSAALPVPPPAGLPPSPPSLSTAPRVSSDEEGEIDGGEEEGECPEENPPMPIRPPRTPPGQIRHRTNTSSRSRSRHRMSRWDRGPSPRRMPPQGRQVDMRDSYVPRGDAYRRRSPSPRERQPAGYRDWDRGRKFNIYPVPVNVTNNSQSASLDKSIKGAIAYLSTLHNMSKAAIEITDAYEDRVSGIFHVYARQNVHGYPVVNAVANININAQGRVISSGHTFADLSALASASNYSWSQPSSAVATGGSSEDDSLRSAIRKLAAHTGSAIDQNTLQALTVSSAESGYSMGTAPCTATKVLIYSPTDGLIPIWHITWQQSRHWWSAHVNAQKSSVEALNDWAYQMGESYKVLPRTVVSPIDKQSQFPELVLNPANRQASPRGWVRAENATTIGNNVWAQSNPTGGDSYENNYRPGASLNATAQTVVFDFPLDLALQPRAYVDFSTTQLFYTVNTMHDLAYLYGFDEAAGNFQDVNYSGKGVGGDAIVAYSQDGGAMNNAVFLAPPDGQRGIMRMYLWNATVPERDGCLEQDIVAHEFTHGISSRLTGGPSNADCLGGDESSGMGEGWSDAVAYLLRIRSNDTRSLDINMGEYVFGKGIRSHPYSTSMQTNPLTYAILDDPQYHEVHRVGEVWAAMLYELVWNLIDALGCAPDLFSHDLGRGNCLFLQIILDAMKLQPCNPDFVQARDAILQAEHNLTGGRHSCAVWRAFAKRGLGAKAGKSAQGHSEDYSTPEGCSGKERPAPIV